MGKTRNLPAGKVPVRLLGRLLQGLQRPPTDRRVVVGPGVGLDAAAIRWGRGYLVAKTDPITLVGTDVGAYALTINANDLATMGAHPRWFLATMLLPAGRTTARDVAALFRSVRQACQRLQVTLCGGHTEVTTAVTRPVVVGSLFGECRPGRLVTTAGARVGDALVLTKGIPIEAVSILARERTVQLRRRFSSAFLSRCRRFLHRPGLSVVRDAAVALGVGGVHAMHDPTEGGLSSALYELAEAAGVGVRVEANAIPILPEGAALCQALSVDPMGAIASGALLVSVAPARVTSLLRALRRARIPATRIGTVVRAREGVTLVGAGGRRAPLPRFEVDEVARVLEG